MSVSGAMSGKQGASLGLVKALANGLTGRFVEHYQSSIPRCDHQQDFRRFILLGFR